MCGFSEVQEALEFHHVNSEEKEFSICGSNSTTKALEAQLKEMKKCILVCANCHRGIHHGIYSIPNNWKNFYDDEIADNLLKKLEKKKYYCHECGVELKTKATRCPHCARLYLRKVERPSRDELKSLIRSLPFTQIGEKFGVADNTIRKWCKAENLPSKKTIINNYSDEEWAKI